MPKYERPTLVISPNESRCGECGQGADPKAETHDRVLGYQPGDGCGARWVNVTTWYTGGHIEARIKEMRPDLTFVPIAEALSHG